jgi:hypothetical protein
MLGHLPDEDPTRLAVFPLIEETLHDLFCEACPCAPEIRLVKTMNGPDSTIFIHHIIRN